MIAGCKWPLVWSRAGENLPQGGVTCFVRKNAVQSLESTSGIPGMPRPQKKTKRASRIARSERFEARLTDEQKDLIARAAAMNDESLTGFVVREAVKAARSRVLEEEIVRLTREDRRLLVSALSHHEAPNAALRKAYERYKRAFPR